jgi:hypothetical protein
MKYTGNETQVNYQYSCISLKLNLLDTCNCIREVTKISELCLLFIHLQILSVLTFLASAHLRKNTDLLSEVRAPIGWSLLLPMLGWLCEWWSAKGTCSSMKGRVGGWYFSHSKIVIFHPLNIKLLFLVCVHIILNTDLTRDQIQNLLNDSPESYHQDP